MGSRRTEVIIGKLAIWDTDEVRGRITNHARGLANAVAICTVIASDGAIFQTRSLVTGTGDGVGSPRVRACREVGLPSTGHTAWCNALVSSVRLDLLMGSRRTSVISRKCVGWDADKVCARKSNDARGLTNTVAVSAVVAGNGAVFETCTLVAGTAD